MENVGVFFSLNVKNFVLVVSIFYFFVFKKKKKLYLKKN